MPYRLLLPALLAITCWVSCIPPTGEVAPAVAPQVDLTDSLTRRLLDHQTDRRQDSLRAYLGHPAARYRYLAARALAQLPAWETVTVDSLLARLGDPAGPVREQVAFALGQTGQQNVAPALAAAFDPEARYPEADAAILRAVGRTGSDSLVYQLATIPNYAPTDTLLRAGQLWGLYYAALRDITPPPAGELALRIVLDRTAAAQLRHPAAHYLQRVEVATDSAQLQKLIDLLRTERDPVVRQALVWTIGRQNTPAARVALLRQLEGTDDWRLRAEVIRSLGTAPYASVRESIVEALRDPHPLVRQTATEYLTAHGTEDDAPFYYQLATSTDDSLTAARLLGAANRHLSPYLGDYRDNINADLRRRYRKAPNPYLRAEVVRALGEYPWNYRPLTGYVREEAAPVVRTTLAEQLNRIGTRDDFADWFRGSRRRVRRELAAAFRTFIEGREEGPAYFAARALTEQPEAYLPYFPDTDWIGTALEEYELPRQLETYREVVRAAASLRGEPPPEVSPPSVRPQPIDWSLLTEPRPTVMLTTDGGAITLELWPRLAPATVSNFLRLVGRGYYDGKVFHRVVPNFVAQGGGPRGDGFGSEDFVLPTETPPLHWDRAGLLGMASAGRDTEGVQFFITHRPTPHLDGGYTIFGEVIEGQKVADRLVPGATIRSIRRIDE